MSKEEAIEEIVVFEDEYPKYIGSTTVVPDPTWENEKADDKPTGNKYPIYTFKDTGLKNFTEDFRLNGDEFQKYGYYPHYKCICYPSRNYR